MSLTVSAYGPHEPTARLYGKGPDAFACIDTDGITLVIHTRAEAGALARAALAARDQLPACGAVAEHTGRTCEMDPGHDGWHHAGMITWEPTKPPATTCPICGAALEPSGVCKVCTAVPIAEYPVSHLGCGCVVQDVMPIGPGTPMVCGQHGETAVVASPEAAQ